MRNDYPAHGVRLRPEIVHLAEFVAPLADAATVENKLPPAFYHDPCYLGRHSGVYEPPRRALGRAVTEVREFSRCREGASCSGGGGLLPWTMPEAADAIASERLAEVKEAGSTRVVTACPACKKRLTQGGVIAQDLVDVLEEATRPK